MVRISEDFLVNGGDSAEMVSYLSRPWSSAGSAGICELWPRSVILVDAVTIISEKGGIVKKNRNIH